MEAEARREEAGQQMTHSTWRALLSARQKLGCRGRSCGSAALERSKTQVSRTEEGGPGPTSPLHCLRGTIRGPDRVGHTGEERGLAHPPPLQAASSSGGDGRPDDKPPGASEWCNEGARP
ncbi:hypothetical protein NDU88_004274 [Pleurodeles waltl]|uniref:Uncharacterized protein n=1 Tax=Pleurodeles waltl TaxID=8319 RepID=A0AAV7VFU4_PLEWA|nr:hypothetical protein NDU88_004274 [Pleurodeles waltl]